jgi:hypothetical protein
LKHSEYINAIKKAAIDTGKKILVRKVAEKLPFLFLPILNPITKYVLEKIVELIINETEFAIFFQYTDMRVDREGREFSEAAMKNLKAQMSGDASQILQAEKELMEKFKNFVVLSKEG